MSKKLKKALGLGLAAIAASKFMGAKKDALKKAVTDTGDFGSQMKNDTVLAEGTRKAMLSGASKIKSKQPYGYGDAFGLGPMDGAKKGKMITAKSGTMVMAKGCKLGRKKPTRIT